LPTEYQEAVNAIGDSLFVNTSYSFRKAVDKTLEYAQKLAAENGGEATSAEMKVKVQEPQPMVLEVAFPKLVFDRKANVYAAEGWEVKGRWASFGNKQAKFSGNKGDEISFAFEGTGVSIVGNWVKDGGKADVFVDGQFKRSVDCSFNFANQQHDNMNLFHVTNLPEGKHTVKLVVKGEKRPESAGTNVYVTEAVVYKTANKINEDFKFSFQE
jgi:hypothetical protein